MPTERIISNIYYFPSYNNDIYSFYGLDTAGKSSLSSHGRYSLQIVRIWNFPSFCWKEKQNSEQNPLQMLPVQGNP